MNLLELAKQADVAVQVQTSRVGGGWDTSYIITPDIERFAQLVRAAALEEAAGVCDVTARYEDWELLGGAEGKELCNALAAAIRALKESKT